MFKHNLILTSVLAVTAALTLTLDLTGKLEARAFLHHAAAPVSRLDAYLWEIDKTAETRVELETRLATQSLALGRLYEYKRENDALRARLGLEVTAPYDLVYARVDERPAEKWLRSMTVNAGRNAGVKPGMPVIGTAGLIGRITSVTADAAEVELITSERMRVAAVHAPSGNTAVYYADASGQGHLSYLPRTTPLLAGDLVVTAATSGIYPRGLILGYVGAFDLPFDSMFAQVSVVPAEDFNAVESVFIVEWQPPEGGGLK